MIRYAASIGARIAISLTESRCVSKPAIIAVHDHDQPNEETEALADDCAFKLALQEWPIAEGWSGHDAAIMLIPEIQQRGEDD